MLKNVDVLLYLVSFLDLSSLSKLGQTNKFFHEFLLNDGFRLYALQLRLPRRQDDSKWSEICKRGVFIESNFIQKRFGVQSLIGSNRTVVKKPGSRDIVGWSRKCQPIVKFWDNDKVLISKGIELELYTNSRGGWVERMNGNAPGYSTIQANNCYLSRKTPDDIIGISSVLSAGNQVIIAHNSGLIKRVKITERDGLQEVARYQGPAQKTNLRTIATNSSLLATASTNIISIYSIPSPWTPPISFKIDSKPHSLLLPIPNTLIVGTSSLSPLSVYTIDSTGSTTAAPWNLGNEKFEKKTAVYDLTFDSDQPNTIIAALFCGKVSLYDLRSAKVISNFSDRMSDEPIFSVASSGFVISAGTARNGVIQLFDRRMESQPISIFASIDSSPVYSLSMHHGKIFGGTERRGFVIEFDVEIPRRGLESASYFEHNRGTLLRTR